MNIGLNITQNTKNFNSFLEKIKIKTKEYNQCNFIDVSSKLKLDQYINDLDILLTYNFTPYLFKKSSKKLKWIHFGVAGVEDSLFDELIKSNIILSNSSGIHAGPVSEFILASILYYCKRFDACVDFKISRKWDQWEIAKTMIQLKNKKIGIIGYGAIGKATAKLAKQFGMKVIATKRLQKTISSNKYVDRLIPLANINELYKQSDFIVITCPLTPLTKHMLSFEQFKIMKQNTYIINIARGGIINDDALIYALDNNQISGATLDVFNNEPLNENNLFFNYKNLFLSPHISGNFPEYQSDMIDQFCDNLLRFFNKKSLKNQICKKQLY